MKMKTNLFNRYIKGILLAAAVVVFTVCELPVITDSYEPNDSYSDAAAITVGASISATIQPEGDQDFYKVTVSSEEDSVQISYNLDVPGSIRPEVRFYFNENDPAYIKHNNTPGASLSDELKVPVGEFVVLVRSVGFEESDTFYHFKLSLVASK